MQYNVNLSRVYVTIVAVDKIIEYNVCFDLLNNSCIKHFSLKEVLIKVLS
jgi:hypothetical protein